MTRRIFATTALAIWLAPLHAEEKTFQPPPITVRPGFSVEMVAGPPLVTHPMMAGFDDKGRLYVADSAGLNLRYEELLKELPNSVRMLEDTDGDGKFDKSTAFADKMTFPMGALWHDGAVYTAAPPYIWKLRDTDGDGIADERTPIVGKFGSNGNAADIHGCFLGPDGRIYWLDGRHGHEFEAKDNQPSSKGLAARFFSCKPDGSDVQVYAGGGMDNPVEVAFTAEGDALGTVAIFDSRPARQDALIHWVYGGVYPHHTCVSEFKRTGDLLPPVSRFGQVAPSGVMRYRDGQFGKDYANNYFNAQFDTHKIVRTVLERNGATYSSRDEDFLVSPSIDFHPTDVLQDADGSMLVIDTGGWFRIGCPLSQVAKPDIKGAIYRVRKLDAKPPADPRGVAMDWEKASIDELVKRLDDERFMVRDRAIATLAKRSEEAVEPLTGALKGDSPRARRNAVWTLCRIGTPKAAAAIRSALADKDPGVRQAAVRSAGTLHDAQAASELAKLVTTDEPQIKREAATTLGQLGQASAVPAIFASLRAGSDRFLEHSLIYALIEINDPEATGKGLSDASPLVRRAALIALDQMDRGQLTRDMVTPLLDTSDIALQQTALDVIGKRQGWASEIVGLLSEWLAEKQISEQRSSMIRGALLAFKADPKIQSLVGETLARKETPIPVRLLLLEVIARSELAKAPDIWLSELGKALAASNDSLLLQAVRTTAATGTDRFDDRLSALGNDSNRSEAIRLAALRAIATRGKKLEDGSFDFLVGHLKEETPALERLEASEILGRAALSQAQLTKLAELLPTAGPLELPALVVAFEKSQDSEIGRLFVKGLASSSGLTSLAAPRVVELLARYPQDVRDAGKPLVVKLSVDIEKQKARLTELEPFLAKGDPARGKEIFHGKKVACFACHRINNEGGLVGPDLSKISQIRAPRDLLEAIVFPSASFARGFEPYTIATDAGDVHSGVIVRETADAVYLVNAQRAEIRIGRGAIEAMAPSKVSIMPQGFDQTATPREISDLIAYLRTLK